MFSFLWFVKVRPSHKQLWFVQDRFPPSALETIVRGTPEPPLKAPPQNALAVVLSGWHWMLEVVCSPQQGQKLKHVENLLTVVYLNFFLSVTLWKQFWVTMIYLYIKIAAISFLYSLSVLGIDLLKFENCPRFQIYKILFKDTRWHIYRNSWNHF